MASLNEDQADVVNDNGRKLPKVPSKYCENVHYFYSVYKLANAFKCSRWRAFEVMVSLNED